MSITFLPGGNEVQVTVVDWFTLLPLLAMVGGLASMVWYLLIAQRFWRLAQDTVGERSSAAAAVSAGRSS
jgi:hypothetical protein